MAKRKKKIYTKPKKIKHTNKNNDIIDFIKSFSNQRCTNCCSLIANHKDRLYCGKCQIHFDL